MKSSPIRPGSALLILLLPVAGCSQADDGGTDSVDTTSTTGPMPAPGTVPNGTTPTGAVTPTTVTPTTVTPTTATPTTTPSGPTGTAGPSTTPVPTGPTGGAGGTGTMGPAGGGTGAAGPSGGGTGTVGTGGGTGVAAPGGGGTGTMGPSGGGTGTMATGGSGAGGAGDAIPPTFETLQLVIMALGCDGSDCHSGSEFNPLDLVRDQDLYMNLTTTIAEKCENLPIVDPGNPDGSALMKVITGPCGDLPQMPAGCVPGEGGGCVPPEYVAAIEQWITDGAPEN